MNGTGGGIYNSGATADISNDAFAGETAVNGIGGGIYNSGTTADISDDTFFGDAAPNHVGGGIYNDKSANVTNDTFFQYMAKYVGAGAFNNYTSTATFTDDTFANDTVVVARDAFAAGLLNANVATVSNSIFDTAACGGTPITDDGYNVLSTTSGTCGFSTGAHDVLTSATIDLASTLATNGSTGPETLALGATSSAVDEVAGSSCTVATDERGDPRPGVTGQTSCDAGAYEYQHTASTLRQVQPTAASVPVGTAYHSSLTVSGATGTVTYTTTTHGALVKVLATGTVTAAATAPAGTYSLHGSDSDRVNDSGTWTFALTVDASPSPSPSPSPPSPGSSAPSPRTTPPKGSATTVITTTHTGNLIVAPGKSVFLDGATITGNVTVPKTASFSATGGTVHGSILSTGGPVSLSGTTVTGTLSIVHHTSTKGDVVKDGTLLGATAGTAKSTAYSHVCGATIGGNLVYEGNTADVVIGGSRDCRGNIVRKSLTVENNTAAISIDGNVVTGDIVVSANKGGGTLVTNTAGGSCALSGDSPRVTGRGNKAKSTNTCNGLR